MLFYSYFNKGRVVGADVVRLDKPAQLKGHRFDELRLTGTLDRDCLPFKLGLRPWLQGLHGCFYQWDEKALCSVEKASHQREPSVFFVQARLYQPAHIEFLLHTIHSHHYDPSDSATWRLTPQTEAKPTF